MSELPPEPPPAEPEVTTAAALEPGADHPIRLIVTDDLKRSRLTVFFRLLLAIPHIHLDDPVDDRRLLRRDRRLVRGALHGSAARRDAQLPRPSYQRYSTHLNAYISCSRIPYPPFNGQHGRLHRSTCTSTRREPRPMDDPPPDHPGDPGPDSGLGLQPGASDRRLPRLVRLHRHRADAEGHARPGRLLPSLRSSRPTAT